MNRMKKRCLNLGLYLPILPAINWCMLVTTYHSFLMGVIVGLGLYFSFASLAYAMWRAIPEEEWKKYDDYI